MNGVRRTGASYSVDGTEATANPEGRQTSSFGGANYVDFMSIEAIQEVHTVKGVFAGRIRRGGLWPGEHLTRSGTNEFHGSLFENFQSDSLNAQNPFLDVRQYLNKAAFAKIPIDPESRATIRPGNLGWGVDPGFLPGEEVQLDGETQTSTPDRYVQRLKPRQLLEVASEY